MNAPSPLSICQLGQVCMGAESTPQSFILGQERGAYMRRAPPPIFYIRPSKGHLDRHPHLLYLLMTRGHLIPLPPPSPLH